MPMGIDRLHALAIGVFRRWDERFEAAEAVWECVRSVFLLMASDAETITKLVPR
jgi:hypothetical protein